MYLRPDTRIRFFVKTVWVLAVFCLFCLGCEKITSYFQTKTEPAPPPIEGTLLAKVNDYVITLEDFNSRLENLSELSEDIKIETFDDKKEFLNELISQELLYQEARNTGLAEDKEIKQAVEEFRKTLLVRKYLDQQLGTATTVGSKEIEEYYNIYKEYFRESEERRIREIVTRSEARAKDILIELLRGADFATLARENSIADSKTKGGDLGFIIRGVESSRFDEIGFSLGVGEFSNIFKGPKGYYIIKVEEKKGGELKSLSEVWDELKSGLMVVKQREAYQDLVSRLRTQASLKIQEDLLR